MGTYKMFTRRAHYNYSYSRLPIHAYQAPNALWVRRWRCAWYHRKHQCSRPTCSFGPLILQPRNKHARQHLTRESTLGVLLVKPSWNPPIGTSHTGGRLGQSKGGRLQHLQLLCEETSIFAWKESNILLLPIFSYTLLPSLMANQW